jgi:hypothetical protein
MTIKLNRNKLFLIGVGIVFIYVLLNRVDYIFGSNITTGEIVRIRSWSGNRSSYTAPIVKFSTETNEITFQGTTNMDASEGETVDVIYKANDPTNAEIYSFVGFWLSPLIYCILPLILLTAASFSFLTASDMLIFNIGKKFTVTKTTKM